MAVATALWPFWDVPTQNEQRPTGVATGTLIEIWAYAEHIRLSLSKGEGEREGLIHQRAPVRSSHLHPLLFARGEAKISAWNVWLPLMGTTRAPVWL